ncbi:hypothetical protein [Streptomyces mirabilis]|uniref:hypothetical protein n=1 Tax=Streptomyces mirabilis TaxID=68239 RepID=UPI0036A7CA5E
MTTHDEPQRPGPQDPEPGQEPAAVATHRQRWAPEARQLPQRLEELHGPCEGIVELPLHVAWSGLRAYNLADEKLLLGLYRTVLTSGFHDDYTTFLNADLLRAHWPRLRHMIGRGVRTSWENAFPQLRMTATAASAAAAA